MYHNSPKAPKKRFKLITPLGTFVGPKDEVDDEKTKEFMKRTVISDDSVQQSSFLYFPLADGGKLAMSGDMIRKSILILE